MIFTLLLRDNVFSIFWREINSPLAFCKGDMLAGNGFLFSVHPNPKMDAVASFLDDIDKVRFVPGIGGYEIPTNVISCCMHLAFPVLTI